MNVATVRSAMATRAATITGLHTAAGTPDSVTPAHLPLCIVGFPELIERMDPTGVRAVFPVWVIVSRANQIERAQTVLDGFLSTSGATSVVAAIETTTSGVDSIEWQRTAFYGTGYEFGGDQYLGAQLLFEVYADE